MLGKYLSQSPLETAAELYNNKVVRYFFAAGTATLVDVSVYFITLHYFLHKQNLHLSESVVIGAPSVSLFVSYSSGLVTNFLITKYFVFAESELKGRTQFTRFVAVALVVLFANYLFMSFLIKVMHIFPTPARAISALSIGVFSFTAHKFFSFRMR